jgi:hypothetical protein
MAGEKIDPIEEIAIDTARDFVRRYGETWESWDIGGFLALFTEDVIYVAHPDELMEGASALRVYFEKEKAAQGKVSEVRMGEPLIDGARVMAEFWVLAAEDVSIAGCLIAELCSDGRCPRFREYWFDLEGHREPFANWGT